mmetsp:Transcript_996/g.2079  ORF Transcript_996/g.2079 Transcript_996/m.2079 type:complete len:353 (+) Transcript_996:9103-10161(+)
MARPRPAEGERAEVGGAIRAVSPLPPPREQLRRVAEHVRGGAAAQSGTGGLRARTQRGFWSRAAAEVLHGLGGRSGVPQTLCRLRRAPAAVQAVRGTAKMAALCAAEEGSARRRRAHSKLEAQQITAEGVHGHAAALRVRAVETAEAPADLREPAETQREGAGRGPRVFAEEGVRHLEKAHAVRRPHPRWRETADPEADCAAQVRGIRGAQSRVPREAGRAEASRRSVPPDVARRQKPHLLPHVATHLLRAKVREPVDTQTGLEPAENLPRSLRGGVAAGLPRTASEGGPNGAVHSDESRSVPEWRRQLRFVEADHNFAGGRGHHGRGADVLRCPCSGSCFARNRARIRYRG